jgi:hypothetical protein
MMRAFLLLSLIVAASACTFVLVTSGATLVAPSGHPVCLIFCRNDSKPKQDGGTP